MDAPNNDFRLSGPWSSTSPCKNTGFDDYLNGTDFADLDWDTVTNERVPFDLTGVNPRIWLTAVDIGAYEWKKETQQEMSAPGPGDPTVEDAGPSEPTEP
jgi:hypothetical protein